ncbi:hypothetical protein [Ottowia cancrivicina]|uniref:Transmembrane protein n=1 Tax=Ottowia cancrivicina TaxID=3040346 RepID=A0AAW6RN85_9BURK|nr:hypothetical protein [Ottowia sp. 10c7w1]MDG9698935.1 hypothetical protein [Ottowia sp. 10c7w1]
MLQGPRPFTLKRSKNHSPLLRVVRQRLPNDRAGGSAHGYAQLARQAQQQGVDQHGGLHAAFGIASRFFSGCKNAVSGGLWHSNSLMNSKKVMRVSICAVFSLCVVCLLLAAKLATGFESPAANHRQTRRQMKMIRRFLQAPGRARAQTFPLLQLDSMEEKHHARTCHSGSVFAFVLRGGAGLACCVCCGCGGASGRGRV